MPKRRRTSAYRAQRRARFWSDHGDKLRTLLVGGGVALVGAAIASLALR